MTAISNRRRGAALRLALIFSPVALGACSSIKVACPAIAAFGIALTVVDSVTEGPVAGSTVLANFGGSYVDTLMNATTSNEFNIPGGGTINLHVITPGYRDWTESGINVAVNSCDIPTEINLTARLQR
jgi:hypothetical protein